MVIRSFIKESNTTICEVRAIARGNHTRVQHAREQHQLGTLGQASCERLYTEGLCILEVNYSLHQPVTDQFTIGGEHIHLSLFFQGHSVISGLSESPALKLDGGLLRSHFQPDFRVDVTMQPGEPIRYVSITMTRNYLLALLKHEEWALNNPLIDAVQRSQYFQLDREALAINHTILGVVHQLFDSRHPGAQGTYRRAFVDMKMRELLFLLYLQFLTDLPRQPQLSADTVDALQKARALLTTNFIHPPTLQQLSREVLLNEKKLKQGFRLLFNNTVYGYVVQLRMEEAGRLILNPDFSVSQLSAQLGYKSTSHFIVAFKRYYGCTPRQAALQKIRLQV